MRYVPAPFVALALGHSATLVTVGHRYQPAASPITSLTFDTSPVRDVS
jgi:hypothetical protein